MAIQNGAFFPLLAAISVGFQSNQPVVTPADRPVGVPASPAARPAPAEPAPTKPTSTPVARGRTAEDRATRAAGVAAPPLSAEPKVVDFGFLLPNTPGIGTVTLTNTTGAPVTIDSVVASCKCTTINKLDGVVIEPGKSQSLEVKLDGAPSMGTRRSSVKVIVAGSGRPLDIPVRAEVSLPVRTVPPYVNAVGGKNLSGRFVVESIDKSPFRVLSTLGGTMIEEGAGTTDSARPSHVMAYDITAMADALPTHLYVETDSERAPLVEVRVRSERIDRSQSIDFLDTRAVLGRVTPGASCEAVLVTRTARQKVERVTCESPGASVKLLVVDATEEGGQRVRLKVTMPTDAVGIVRVPFTVWSGESAQAAEVVASVRKPAE